MKAHSHAPRILLLPTCRPENLQQAAIRCKQENPLASVSVLLPENSELGQRVGPGIEIAACPAGAGRHRLARLVSRVRTLRSGAFDGVVIPLDDTSGDYLSARLVALLSAAPEIAVLPMEQGAPARRGGSAYGTTILIPRWRLAAGILRRLLRRALRSFRPVSVPSASAVQMDRASQRLRKIEMLAPNWSSGRDWKELRITLVCRERPADCRRCAPLVRELQSAGAFLRLRSQAEYESDIALVFEDGLQSEVWLLEGVEWSPAVSWILGLARRLHRATIFIPKDTPPPYRRELALSSPVSHAEGNRELSVLWLSDYIAPATEADAEAARSWGKNLLEGFCRGKARPLLQDLIEREAAVARRMPLPSAETIERHCRQALSGRRFIDGKQWETELLEKCPLCGSASWQACLWSAGWQLLRCQGCELICLNPRPTQSAIADHYRKGRYDSVRWDGRTYLQKREQWLRKFTEMLTQVQRFQPAGRLLDVGCGPGFLMEAARRLGYEPYGIEASEQGVEFAKKELGLEVEQGRFEETHYPEGFFQVVIFSDILEHVPDPIGFLAQAYRALAPGGIIDVSLTDAGCEEALRDKDKWWALSLPTHFYQFTEKTLREALQRAGFEVVHLWRHWVLMDMIARKISRA